MSCTFAVSYVHYNFFRGQLPENDNDANNTN